MASRWSAAATLIAATLAARGASARTYEVVASRSSAMIHVGKAGLFKGFGHEHDITVTTMSGRVDFAPADPAMSRVSLAFEAPSLRVVPDGGPPKDVAKVQETMLGPDVLDAAHHPRILFTSRSCAVQTATESAIAAQVIGDLDLHGISRPLTVPVVVEVKQDQLIARGSVVIRQSDFGIKPVTVAGGSVKVKDEVTIRFTIVARATGD